MLKTLELMICSWWLLGPLPLVGASANWKHLPYGNLNIFSLNHNFCVKKSQYTQSPADSSPFIWPNVIVRPIVEVVHTNLT